MCQKHKQGESRGSCRQCIWCLFPWHRTIWAHTSLKRISAGLCGWWWDTTLHEQRRNHAFWSSQRFAFINKLVCLGLKRLLVKLQETLSSKRRGKAQTIMGILEESRNLPKLAKMFMSLVFILCQIAYIFSVPKIILTWQVTASAIGKDQNKSQEHEMQESENTTFLFFLQETWLSYVVPFLLENKYF